MVTGIFTMNTLLHGSICLTDIPKEKITTSEKNGKKYLSISVWINDEPDQFNNNASIQVSQSKEERESGGKKSYIGNLKYAQKPQDSASVKVPDLLEDLPF